MSSSAEGPRFDAIAAAQQMLALEAAAEAVPAPTSPFPTQAVHAPATGLPPAKSRELSRTGATPSCSSVSTATSSAT